MCGIVGIAGTAQIVDLEEKIGNMQRAMVHRGPDDEGKFIAETIGLGHRRLSIIDLSSAGHQPMHSTDARYTLVFNGEIYNYRQLKSELKDYPFTTETDSEVLLAAYATWGENCLDRLNGMYAFAIWDNQENKLFLARDRMGIKPLYYAVKNHTLVFASELRSLLASDIVDRKLNRAVISDYLQYQVVHAPNTIVHDVFMLMPGHKAVFKNGNLDIKQYWDISSDEPVIQENYVNHKKNIYNLLLSSVQDRLVADVPFGAFLSGGIDSSIIVGLMSKVSTNKVSTFSVTFEEEEFSEQKYAELIAKRFETNHHNIKLTLNDFLEDLPKALDSMDHPSGDGVNTFVVSKATKQAGITMALSGLGGDELFAGYHIFKRAYSLENNKLLQSTPQSLRALAGKTLKAVRPSVASNKISEVLNLPQIDIKSFYPTNRKLYLDNELMALISSPYQNQVSQLLSKYSLHNFPLLSQVSIAEISTYMQNVLLQDADQMSMASSLEVRVPFLDHRLVEYVLRVEDQYKYPHSPKKLLVDAVGELIPDEIVNRPKMGFVLPWDEWMRRDLKDFCHQKISSFAQRDFVNDSILMGMWKDFQLNTGNIPWIKLWEIVVLENWLIENNIE